MLAEKIHELLREATGRRSFSRTALVTLVSIYSKQRKIKFSLLSGGNFCGVPSVP